MKTTKITIYGLFVALLICIAPAIADAALQPAPNSEQFECPPTTCIHVTPAKTKTAKPAPDYGDIAAYIATQTPLTAWDYEAIEDGNITFTVIYPPAQILFTYDGVTYLRPICWR